MTENQTNQEEFNIQITKKEFEEILKNRVQVKPGAKSTETYGFLIAFALAFLTQTGIIDSAQADKLADLIWSALYIFGAIAFGGYRTLIKNNDNTSKAELINQFLKKG